MQIRLKLAHHALETKYPYEIKLYGAGGNGTLIFQPRDGTRYVIVFREATEAGECSALGHSSGPCSFVGVMRGNNQYAAAVFGDAPPPYYLQKKLDCNEHTAQMVARALEFLFNETDPGPFHER